jgi:hypothetical protein
MSRSSTGSKVNECSRGGSLHPPFSAANFATLMLVTLVAIERRLGRASHQPYPQTIDYCANVNGVQPYRQ